MLRKVIIGGVVIVALLVVGMMGLAYWATAGDGPRRALEEQSTAWLGEPVAIGSAEVSVFPRAGIRLTDVRIGNPVRQTLTEVDLSTNLRELIGGRIEDAAVMVTGSRLEMPFPIPMATGEGSSDAADDGYVIHVASVRRISLDDVRLSSGGREFVVFADLTLAGERLHIERFVAEAEATRIEAEGDVDLGSAIEARLQAHSESLDLEELLALGQAFASSGPSGSGEVPADAALPVTLDVDVTVDTATAAGLTLEQLTAHMRVDGAQATLSPLAFGLFGGRYEGSLGADLSEGVSVDVDTRVEDLDVARLAAFGGSPDTISGTMRGEGTFEAAGPDLESALAEAHGTGAMTIADGEIQQLDLVRTVVLAFGRPEPDTLPPSDAFERIEATFSLADQVARADAFSMRSRDADLDGSVELNLATTSLDGSVQMRLSSELSAQAGRDLVRYTRDGDRVLLPATIGGTLDEPALSIDTTDALRRGLVNEAERRLNRLFGR